jgi:hypothetical protein
MRVAALRCSLELMYFILFRLLWRTTAAAAAVLLLLLTGGGPRLPPLTDTN